MSNGRVKKPWKCQGYLNLVFVKLAGKNGKMSASLCIIINTTMSRMVMNEKFLSWHLFEDVFGWAAVFVVSVVLLFVEWSILDPLLAVTFTVFILFNIYKYLKKTLRIFF